MTSNRERFVKNNLQCCADRDEQDAKGSLSDPVTDPVKAHVRCFRHPWGDGVLVCRWHTRCRKTRGWWVGGLSYHGMSDDDD
jgi:hypothetical protein